jgi:hypothetical protein
MSINSIYQDKETLKIIKENYSQEFEATSMHEFFDEKTAKELKKKLEKLEYSKIHQANLHSYKVTDIPKEINEMINSKEVLEILGEILGQKVKSINLKAYLFTWKHFTLLKEEKEDIDIYFDFSEFWQPNLGGSFIYTDGKGNFEEVEPSFNTLSIVNRKSEMKRFMKYINNLSRETRRYVLMGSVNF